MMYVIARTATKNPDIKGRTLYLTSIGFWSLDIDNALRYDNEQDAERTASEAPATCRNVRVEAIP